jgi:hypothetical protein
MIHLMVSWANPSHVESRECQGVTRRVSPRNTVKVTKHAQADRGDRVEAYNRARHGIVVCNCCVKVNLVRSRALHQRLWSRDEIRA